MRAGILFDEAGTPIGVDNYVYQDLDAAIQLAKQNNMSLLLSYFDFTSFKKKQLVHNVQIGGRSNVFAEQQKQDALIANVVAPVVRRYAQESTIFSHEVRVILVCE